MGLPSIGPLELIIILAIALLIVGPGRLPEMGSAIGRTIREFRHASSDMAEAVSVESKTVTPVQPQPNALTDQAIPNVAVAPVAPVAADSANEASSAVPVAPALVDPPPMSPAIAEPALEAPKADAADQA